MSRHLLLLTLACALGCSRSVPPPAPTPGTGSVLLVTIDTLRADRLGCYGDADARTPVIDRLAREGVVFERAYTPVPITLPAHASILTGLLPPAHGVRANGAFALGPERPTLAEVFRARGTATAAFVGAFPLARRFGMSRGFDHYDDAFGKAGGVRYEFSERPGSQVVAAALAWLRGQAGPVFLWVHLFEPHAPYEPPPQFAAADPYRGEIAAADAALAPLIAAWDARGGGAIALLSDHGEAFGEHGEESHSLFVYDTTLRVPGTARSLTGPGGPLYTLLDADASYGTIAAGATASCRTTGDCYELAVTTPSARPLLHWDAVLDERLSTSQLQRWHLHVGESFADVPRTRPTYRFVEPLLHRGVSSGCGGGAYCPAAATVRDQMTAFVLAAREGAGYGPFPCLTGSRFSDVPMDHPFCGWIEELARRGVVAGCGGGNFCPGRPVTRAETAVLVLRTLDPSLMPPACTTPRFTDVPASSPFCRWIEELALRGAVAGCGSGLYCPGDPTTREQMAVILTVSFGLTLYGP